MRSFPEKYKGYALSAGEVLRMWWHKPYVGWALAIWGLYGIVITFGQDLLQHFNIDPMTYRWQILFWTAVIAFVPLFVIVPFLAFHKSKGELKLARQRIDNLTAGSPEHQKPLLEVLHEIRAIGIVEATDVSFVNWLLSDKGDYTIPLGTAFKDSGTIAIRLHVERQKRAQWEYLQQHLEGSQLAIEIQKWKQSMSDDLRARAELLNAIIRASTGALPGVSFYLNLGDSNFNKAKKPYFTLYFIQAVYQQVFYKAVNGNMAPYEYSVFQEDKRMPDKVCLGSFGTVIMCSDSEVGRSAGKSFLLEAQASLTGLQEAKTVTEAYFEAKTETERCKEEIEKIAVIDARLPLGSKCERCKAMIGAKRK